MSQTLLRNLLDAALEGGLSQNEWRAFAAILIKTIGYGKRSDHPNFTQLANLTGIRKDRIQPAVQALIDKGIFEAAEHRYDRIYTIPAKFFEDGKAQARFFAPSIPFTGKTRQSMAAKTQESGTYRDIPLQSSNYDIPTPPKDEWPEIDPLEGEWDVVVSDEKGNVTFETHAGLTKPADVTRETYDHLENGLKTLPKAQANDVLQLLALAIRNHSIKTTPTRLGGALIKAAKAGTLDTSALQAMQQEQAARAGQNRNTLAVELNNCRAEIASLQRLYARANIPMPDGDSLRVAAYQARIMAIQAELGRM